MRRYYFTAQVLDTKTLALHPYCVPKSIGIAIITLPLSLMVIMVTFTPQKDLY